MSKGIRFIDGKEFMLNGRYSSKPRAEYVAEAHGREWEVVKVLKTPHRFGDYSVWVHGRKVAECVA